LFIAPAPIFATSSGETADPGSEATAPPPVVVELFTSQGCNSCPPAEAFLAELADEEGILALEMHVDYWDYIGWKDPFGSAFLTARQQSYAGDLRQRYVYTPQMVIDGRKHVTGSHRGKVRAAIADRRAERQTVLNVRILNQDGGKVVIPAGHSPDEGATVWLAVYDGLHETKVPSGENAGRTLKNRNVVRELVRLGTWTGERLEIPIDLAGAMERGRSGCAVLVQQGQTGPILGAAEVPLEEN
jgi:hypothetical protein